MLNEHRYVAVEISFPFLFEMLTTGHRFDSRIFCKDGLPEGAKFIRSFNDPWRSPEAAIFVFEHESFPPVPDGEMIPRKVILFHRDV